MRPGDSNVYRATSSLAGTHLATSGFTRHVISADDSSTTPAAQRHNDRHSVSGLDDEDDEEEDVMTSLGSGYYDNVDDDPARDYDDAASRAHDSVHDVRSPSSHGRPAAFDVDHSDSRLDDRRLGDDQRASSDVDVKDVSRTLSTTAGVRPVSAAGPWRGSVERRRPLHPPSASSSSSSSSSAAAAAARRRHFADADRSSSTATTASFYTSASTLLSLYCVVAAIVFRSAHVFLSLPLPHTRAASLY